MGDQSREIYDYAITGAGAAGLSLAYSLAQAGLDDKAILLVDREPKRANDRTWCFWERGEGPFDSILYRRWNQLSFAGPNLGPTEAPRDLEMGGYAYKMLRGIDFYTFMENWLDRQPNIVRVYGDVSSVRENESSDGAVICADNREFRARWAFNSIRPGAARPPGGAGYNALLQHFEGWIIRTPSPRFNPGKALLMDFRVPQHGQSRFCYVMPFSEQSALVEFTVFSPDLLPRAEYGRELAGYIETVLGLASGEYEIEHTEVGVIPMTDAPFSIAQSPHVLNVGVAGGRAKSSSGYAFLRIQAQSRAIAAALARGEPPPLKPASAPRFQLYDSVLLNVLQRPDHSGAQVFEDLFARNKAHEVFKFLDERTNVLEEIRVQASVHLPPFVGAAASELIKRARRAIWPVSRTS